MQLFHDWLVNGLNELVKAPVVIFCPIACKYILCSYLIAVYFNKLENVLLYIRLVFLLSNFFKVEAHFQNKYLQIMYSPPLSSKMFMSFYLQS